MLCLQNFKGFARAELDILQPLTMLVGPNGSGKSNAIEGVELFSFIVKGQPLHQISDLGRGGVLEIRGGLEGCARYGQPAFSMGFQGTTYFDGTEDLTFSYSLTIKPTPRPRIVEEKLSFDDGTMIFETVEASQSEVAGTNRVRYNNFARGPHKPIVEVSDSISVLAQYTKVAKKHSRIDHCRFLVTHIMSELGTPFVFDPVPGLMRNYERIGNQELLRNGSNISAVLHALQQGDDKAQESLSRLLGWLQQLPEEPYSGVDFVTTQLNDVIFGFVEGSEGQFVDARLLSDGTLRALAVLTALETTNPHSLVIIEEFDNGLHPSRVRVLTEALASCSERRDLKVLVTTHNPATLDILEPKQLEGVVLCFWDKTLEASRLLKLSEIPRSDELLERGSLGDLVTRRVLDRYLAPDFEAKRKQRALTWLENMP
jgi:predicted ATPase